MADFIPTARTNYFKVKDKEKFMEWATTLPDAEVGEKDDGRVCLYGGDFMASWDEDDKERDHMAELQPMLADGEACIVTFIGYEKFRYLVAFCLVVTQDATEIIDAPLLAQQKAQEMLGDDSKSFDMDY